MTAPRTFSNVVIWWGMASCCFGYAASALFLTGHWLVGLALYVAFFATMMLVFSYRCTSAALYRSYRRERRPGHRAEYGKAWRFRREGTWYCGDCSRYHPKP